MFDTQGTFRVTAAQQTLDTLSRISRVITPNRGNDSCATIASRYFLLCFLPLPQLPLPPLPAPTSPAASDGREGSGSRSVVHLRTANSAATPDREDGTAHPRVCRAAVDGKPHANKSNRAEPWIHSRP